jgi:hypothetical protein
MALSTPGGLLLRYYSHWMRPLWPMVASMLQKLGDHIRGYYERAAECAERAKAETDHTLRDDLLKMEKVWIVLAKSYEFVQSLESFLLDAHRAQD